MQKLALDHQQMDRTTEALTRAAEAWTQLAEALEQARLEVRDSGCL